MFSLVILYTTAVCGEPVMEYPEGLVMETDTVPPFATFISAIASVLLVPVPAKDTFLAPVTVILSIVSVSGSSSNVSVRPVDSAVAEVPPI